MLDLSGDLAAPEASDLDIITKDTELGVPESVPTSDLQVQAPAVLSSQQQQGVLGGVYGSQVQKQGQQHQGVGSQQQERQQQGFGGQLQGSQQQNLARQNPRAQMQGYNGQAQGYGSYGSQLQQPGYALSQAQRRQLYG